MRHCGYSAPYVDWLILPRFLFTDRLIALPLPAEEGENEAIEHCEGERKPHEDERESVLGGGALWVARRQVLLLVVHGADQNLDTDDHAHSCNTEQQVDRNRMGWTDGRADGRTGLGGHT